jgi:putative heme iron utilization protein
MEQPAIDLDQVYQEFSQFHAPFQSLLMATVDSQGQPDSSYATYVEFEGSFYIYISELSAHTGNLMQHPGLSVLFIEDESSAGHIFARKRATYRCVASEIERGSESFEQVMDLFADRFGPFINKTMRHILDFHLFRLEPVKASYVQGFARAFDIHGEGLKEIRHMNDKGHRSGKESVKRELSGNA